MSDPIRDAIARLRASPRTESLTAHPAAIAEIEKMLAESSAMLAEDRAFLDTLDQQEADAAGVTVRSLRSRRKHALRKKLRTRRRGDRAGRPL